MIDTPETFARKLDALIRYDRENDYALQDSAIAMIAARDADIRAEAVPIVDAACELVAAICKAADWADGTRVADAIDKLDALLSPPAAERSDP